MSTTIKSKYNALWDIERLDDALVRIDPNGDSGDRVFKTADFLDALRAEGVLTDDGLRERVEDLRRRMDIGGHTGFVGQLDKALNPPKPFQFPTGLGAVISGDFKGGGVRCHLVRCDNPAMPWRSYGSSYSEDEARSHFTNLRTLSEGVAL